MVELKIEFNDNGLANAFSKKGSETDKQFSELAKGLTDIAHRWVQNEAPRKTGNLKASVKKVQTGTQGLVFISKYQAPYFRYVLDGRGPIIAKGKALRFVIGGKTIFVKSVKGAKANPFVDKAMVSMKGEANQRIRMFEKWLGDI
jgi:hypothetical protein